MSVCEIFWNNRLLAQFPKKFEHLKIVHFEFAKSWQKTYLFRENFVTTLSIRNIKVEDVMTKLEDSYMLPLDTVLDFETISEIKEQGPHIE